ncbi:DNA-processing protein DprA [Borrelia hermsii]|uniref:Rossmann fold nucleotide-binding protein involved in DNA uptake n=3 Tax=Borrelia hermsii TaxID=140 RepID=A0AAN0X5Y4_BORHE|nr:DNA-processing protein DprA [Borrelia hermsii]AAX16814.1 Smf protein [Borrelia hermsii DAH]AJW73114.1 DNA repair protein Smf [Borrelia hermsii CC1]AMR75532.1 putative Rossmann fold nucleotide-binding protein involved in DNA uptake [Borrelia hermsii]ANA43113.1 DNA repair protein Smf [Borrelia hermsii HS1]UCP01322.1 DNA-processing protein DprA [Borrelia hermsii]
MFKLLYVDNLKFLKGEEKLRIFNDFDLSELCKLSLRDISNYLSRYFRKTHKLPDIKLIELQQEIINRTGAKVVLLGSKDYPLKLKRIYDPPFAIYYKGNLPDSNSLSWAVVGSRKISIPLIGKIKELSSHLAKNHVEVISGFAIGADIAAHLGAINEKKRTYAVIATDIDNIYPKQNRKYVTRLLENGGGVLTETLPYENIQSYFFAKRNRIVAGLSDVVFITCAPKKSGALITAELGLDLGLDIYVYNIDYSGDGSRTLYDSGAQEIKSVSDLYKILNVQYNEPEISDDLEACCVGKDTSSMLINELLNEISK